MRPTHYINHKLLKGSRVPLKWTGRIKTIEGGPYPKTLYEGSYGPFGLLKFWVEEALCREYPPEVVTITEVSG